MPLRLRLIEFGAGCFVREFFDVAFLAACVWCLVCLLVDLSENEMKEARMAGDLLVSVGDPELAGVKKWIAGSKHGQIVACSTHRPPPWLEGPRQMGTKVPST